MKASKILSLVLAGVMAASMLSGCTKEIIEYQIYTETVSGGSTVSGGNTGAGGSGGSGTAGNTITAQEAFKRLSDLMESHEIPFDIKVGMVIGKPPIAQEKPDDYLTVDLDKLKDWATNKNPYSYPFYVYTKVEDKVQGEPISYTKYLMVGASHVNMLYEKFSMFSDEDWDHLREKINGNILVLQMSHCKTQNDNTYYIETRLKAE